jgi:hypothetical protein
MKREYKSQKQLVLEHLLKGKGITQREATIYFNIIRLGAIIHTLKTEGYEFNTLYKKNYNGRGLYAKYFLKSKKINFDF